MQGCFFGGYYSSSLSFSGSRSESPFAFDSSFISSSSSSSLWFFLSSVNSIAVSSSSQFWKDKSTWEQFHNATLRTPQKEKLERASYIRVILRTPFISWIFILIWRLCRKKGSVYLFLQCQYSIPFWWVKSVELGTPINIKIIKKNKRTQK